MQSQFTSLLQLGIIVDDVDAAVARFEGDFGVGPWQVADFGPELVGEMLIDGEPGELRLRGAFCRVFGFEIELLQPVSDGPYRRWLDEHGPGMHHLAVTTRGSFDDLVAAHEHSTGRRPWIHVQAADPHPDHPLDFAYLDLVKELGIFLEIYNEPKSLGLPT